MPGIIPAETIESILDRVDIVEVVSSYIPLKRAGRNLRALCPFHHEKTPSFMISPDKQIYHCFGCNAGGNALSFVMQYEKVDFLEAIDMLAKKAGVEIEHSASGFKREDVSVKTKLAKINELSSFFYHKNLLSLSDAALARDYLKQRGVNEAAVKNMRLGFAVDKWDSLLEYLKTKGINPAPANQLGLIINNDKGGFYDRFRKRIIFPIFDIRGIVLGFGARVLDNSLPKYINSPESPIYVKGSHLYGLNFSKDAIREKDSCLIVEGYMDFFIPYAHGIDNIVASLGTALTKQQIRLIKRYTHNVVLMYDSDPAGELATLRSLDLFIEEGMGVRIVSLDKGYDPDLFMRKFGVGAFKDRVDNARDLFDYKLEFLKSHYGSGDIQKKAKIIDEMLVTINKLANAVVKMDYLRRLSEELSVPESAIMQEAAKIKSKYTDFAMSADRDKNRLAKFQNNPIAFEKLLVGLILQEEELIHKISADISPGDFQDRQLGKIMATVFELVRLGKTIDPHKLLHHFSDDAEISSLVCELSTKEEEMIDREKAVKECVARLKKQGTRNTRDKLCEAIKDAQRLNDQARLTHLLHEFNDLVKGKVF
ncbi:MAG: DNA primase [Candidatus Omnitrophota bacterium]|nr:DNA primase [Candidatus Omnitrophota bacterium]